MERRLHERIYADQKIIIVHGDVVRTAILRNCSEKGMYIENGMTFPLDSVLKIVIPGNDQVLILPVRVVRSATTGARNGMGVELQDVSSQYLEFLIKLNLGSSF